MGRTGRRALIAGVLVVGVVAAGLAVAVVRFGWFAETPSATAATPPPTAPPPFSTPTPSAPKARAVEPGPDEPVATDRVSSSTATVTAGPQAGKVQVTVVVTDAGSSSDGVEVDGFVQGVVEDGGRCTLRLTRQQRSVEVSQDASPNASTTSCGALVVPAAQVSSGTWEAVLSYSSPRSVGSAAPVSVDVP